MLSLSWRRLCDQERAAEGMLPGGTKGRFRQDFTGLAPGVPALKM